MKGRPWSSFVGRKFYDKSQIRQKERFDEFQLNALQYSIQEDIIMWSSFEIECIFIMQ